MPLTLTLAIGVTTFCLVALAFAPLLLRPAPEAARLLALVKSNRPDQRRVGKIEALQESMLRLARGVRARLGFAENVKLKKRLDDAGLRGRRTLETFYALQFLGPALGAFGGSFIPVNTLFWVFCCAVVGYMAPDFWLTRATKTRRNRVRRSIPDALDLLGICVEAGLGLDQALLRVSSELATSHPEINEEFTQINLEQRAGKARLEAWSTLAERTQIDEFKAFASMLMQTDRFGTPIVKALNQFSEEIRMKRKQHAEEAAAKTKIKIIFPLVLCIFPCVFIVLLAPALMSIASGLESMGH